MLVQTVAQWESFKTQKHVAQNVWDFIREDGLIELFVWCIIWLLWSTKVDIAWKQEAVG